MKLKPYYCGLSYKRISLPNQNFINTNRMFKSLACFSIVMVAGLCSLETKAQVKSYNGQTTVTSAVPFLRISPDARSGAMGDAGIAISPDANSQYWNVAKIPFTEKTYGVSMTYTPWLKDLVPDIFLAYVSGYAKFGKDNNQAISASMRYFSLGNINYTDINAQSLGTGMPREYAFDLGYSRRLSPYLSTGITMRYIHSDIAAGSSGQADYKPGNAVAADLGVYYTKTKELTEFQKRTWNFGAVLSNVGSKISYSSVRKDFLPINLGIGAAYTSQIDAYNKITVALDLNKLLVPAPQIDASGNPYYPDKSVVSGMLGSFSDAPQGTLKTIDISLGAEYWYQNQFSFRAGYFYENPDNGDRQYFTTGVGAKYNIFTINLSYLVPSGSGVTRNPLSNTLRFSLMFEFDKIEKPATSGTE